MPGIANSARVRPLAFIADIATAIVAIVLALWLRYGSLLGVLDPQSLYSGAILPFVSAAGISFIVFRTYRTSWRHVSISDLMNIVYASSTATAIFLLLSFVTTRLEDIPRTSVIMAWMVLILLLSGSRVAYRLAREGRLFLVRRPMRTEQTPALVIGLDGDAELFLRSLDAASPYYAVGILSTVRTSSAQLRGVPVLGVLSDLERIVESYGDAGDRPQKLIIADRVMDSAILSDLVNSANTLGLTLARAPDPRVLRPGIEEKSELQPISVEDLLGRPQIVLDRGPVDRLLSGKRILVTGAGGSIGSEIVRQVCAMAPAAVCLIDSSEFNLYQIDRTMEDDWPAIDRIARLIDVRHRQALASCFKDFRPEIIFHAAALKHVPLVEANSVDGIWTNTIGSRNVFDAAVEVAASAVVLISTDKAVNPSNVMGASKRCAESYCQALAQSNKGKATAFVAVRFGNVLGSTGSVVPLFERQLKRGGPLTVTHPEMERYFMTIREAVQLVMQASALGAANRNYDGRVFVLDMGRPVRIADLARRMIELAGLKPERDISIKYVGLRPGEKLSEELFHGAEKIEATPISRISVASPRTQPLATLLPALDRLERGCCGNHESEAKFVLKELVPEFDLPNDEIEFSQRRVRVGS
jgi:O-antigen biosynthesis protein WbqV